MRAVLVRSFGAPPELTEVADPACPADGVVLRVEATGLCRSDWHGWMGHDADIVLPHVPGHPHHARLALEAMQLGPHLIAHIVLGGKAVIRPFLGVAVAVLAGLPEVMVEYILPVSVVSELGGRV